MATNRNSEYSQIYSSVFENPLIPSEFEDIIYPVVDVLPIRNRQFARFETVQVAVAGVATNSANIIPAPGVGRRIIVHSIKAQPLVTAGGGGGEFFGFYFAFAPRVGGSSTIGDCVWEATSPSYIASNYIIYMQFDPQLETAENVPVVCWTTSTSIAGAFQVQFEITYSVVDK